MRFFNVKRFNQLWQHWLNYKQHALTLNDNKQNYCNKNNINLTVNAIVSLNIYTNQIWQELIT